MGTWSKDAPTLPSGSEWSARIKNTSPTYYESYRFYLNTRYARLAGNGYVVEFYITTTSGPNGGWWSNCPLTCYAYLNGTLESTYTSFTGPSKKGGTVTFYYYGEAAEGDTIRVTIKGKNAYTTASQTYTATAPVTKLGLTLPEMRMGETATILIERASTWLITMTWAFGSQMGTIVADANVDSIEFTPPDLASECNDALSGTIAITAVAYSGTTNVGAVTESTTLSVPEGTTPTIGDVVIGSNAAIHLSGKSSNFTHTLKYSFPSGGSTSTIATGVTGDYTWAAPYSMAAAIPSATSGEGTLYCETYNGTALAGTTTVTFTATVPLDDNTRPTLTMVLSPASSLSSPFDSLFVEKKSKVKAAFTASSAYSSIVSYSLSVAGMSASGNPATTDILTINGTFTATGTVKDARGFTATVTQSITVYSYDNPRPIPYTGQTEVICNRCLSDGTPDDGGTCILIKAGKQYSDVGGNNHGILRYRIKTTTSDTFGAWITVLPKDTDGETSFVGSVGALDKTASYDVEISVIDDLSGETVLKVVIPTDGVTFHMRPGGKAAAFGKYAEEDNLLDVAWDFRVNGSILPTAEYTGDINELISATGYYVCTGCANAPADGFLLVYAAGGFAFQVLLGQNGSINTRAYASGAFTGWTAR